MLFNYTLATLIGLGSFFPTAWSTEVSPRSQCHQEVLNNVDEYFDLIEEYQTAAPVDFESHHLIGNQLFSKFEEIAEWGMWCDEVDEGELLREVVKPYTHIVDDAKALRLYKRYIDAQLNNSQRDKVQEDIDLYYQLTWQLRDFERLNNWPSNYAVSDSTLQEWPEINRFINQQHRNFNLTNLHTDTFEVVVVADLQCGFSQAMFKALESGASQFDEDIELTFAFGQFSNSAPQDIADISRRFSAYQFVLALDDQQAPEGIYYYQFPVFISFITGKSSINSWVGLTRNNRKW